MRIKKKYDKKIRQRQVKIIDNTTQLHFLPLSNQRNAIKQAIYNLQP